MRAGELERHFLRRAQAVSAQGGQFEGLFHWGWGRGMMEMGVMMEMGARGWLDGAPGVQRPPNWCRSQQTSPGRSGPAGSG